MTARKSYTIKVFDHEIKDLKELSKASGKSVTGVVPDDGRQAQNRDRQSRVERLKSCRWQLGARYRLKSMV